MRALAAIVLLGTPHSTELEDWKTFANVLHTGSGTQKGRSLSTEETKILCESARNFEQAGITHRIISVYETQKTKVRKGLFNQKTMVLLIFSRFIWVQDTDVTF